MPSKRKLDESVPFKGDIGVCLDDQIAFVLERRKDENLITVISADHHRGEHGSANLHPYYKKVFESLRDFRKIHLFGTKKSLNEIQRRIKAYRLDNTTVLDEPFDDPADDDRRIDFINRYFSGK